METKERPKAAQLILGGVKSLVQYCENCCEVLPKSSRLGICKRCIQGLSTAERGLLHLTA